MNSKGLIKIISSFFLFIIFILKIAAFSGCANQIPPTGGDRDSLPPVLVKVTPGDSSIHFSNKTITFTFDEFIEDVQQQNPYQNVIISPTPEHFPSIESKLRTLTVKIKDTLEPNTTYYFTASATNAAGVTPGIRPAAPSVAGRTAFSFWRTSVERAAIRS